MGSTLEIYIGGLLVKKTLSSGSTRAGVTNKILRDKNIEHRDR